MRLPRAGYGEAKRMRSGKQLTAASVRPAAARASVASSSVVAELRCLAFSTGEPGRLRSAACFCVVLHHLRVLHQLGGGVMLSTGVMPR